MRRHFFALSAGFAIAAMTVAAGAHHSIAQFDQAHPIELVGTVREFRFTSPHAFIRLEVLDKEAHKVVWNLEGDSPNSLAWGGWSYDTLKPGDELRITIATPATTLSFDTLYPALGSIIRSKLAASLGAASPASAQMRICTSTVCIGSPNGCALALPGGSGVLFFEDGDATTRRGQRAPRRGVR